MSTPTIPTTVTVVTDEGDLTLRQYRGKKSGNLCFGTLSTRANGTRYFHPTGVKVTDKVINAIPTRAEVLGVNIPLKRGKNEKGRARVIGTASVTVPGLGDRRVDIRVTDLDTGCFNVCATLRGAGSSKGGDFRRPVEEL